MSYKEIPEHIRSVCKIGQGAECCKYLLLAPSGFECAKIKRAAREFVDAEWKKTKHTAQGDNCEGKQFEELNK